MRTVFAASVFIASVVAVQAEELALTLLVGRGPHVAGKETRIELVALNPVGLDAPFAPREILSGRLKLDGQALPLILKSTGLASATVPARGFATRSYDVVLPSAVSGEAILEVDVGVGPPLQVVVNIRLASNEVQGARSLLGPVETLTTQTTAIAAVSRNFAGRFLPNQPVYFVYGEADHAAKFQFSFDYRLATFQTDDNRIASGARTLRLGYTQRSLWDLDSQSSPFYDTSYIPEIAFNSDRPMPERVSNLFTWLGWRASLQHESNGRDGVDSRSVNTVYFRARFILGTLGDWAFVVLPEIQSYIGNSGENSELKNYRGYGKPRFYFGRNDRPTVMFTGWSGKDFDHPSYQLDLAVPVQLRRLNLETFFYVQYFDGYGESLRDYSTRSDGLRFGFALIR